MGFNPIHPWLGVGCCRLDESQAMNILRILILALFFISAPVRSEVSYGGMSAVSVGAMCGNFCSSISRACYYVYSDVTFSCQFPGLNSSDAYRTVSGSPGPCISPHIDNGSGRCINPVSCTYPMVRDIPTNTCGPAINCVLPKVMQPISIKDGNVNGVACINPADATPGSAGGPPKVDGTCAPGLVVTAGTCVVDQTGTSGGGSPSGGGGAGANPGDSPKPDGTCVPPLVVEAASGLCYPDCPVGVEHVGNGGSTQTTFCDGSCLFKINMSVCLNNGFCSFSGKGVGASCIDPPDTGCPPGSIFVSEGVQYCRTTLGDTSPGIGPGGGCGAGFHNDNGNPPSCIPNSLSCSPGTHEVAFGGGIGPVCVADTASTGQVNQPPNPNGLCSAPLININGICTDVGGIGGGTGGAPGGPLGGATTSGQCGSPGFPACATDAGNILGQTVEGTDPTSRTDSEIKAALNINNFPLLGAIKGWTLPAHTSTCPAGSFDFKNPVTHATVATISFSPMCDMFEQFRAQISTIFMFLWSVLPFFLILMA